MQSFESRQCKVLEGMARGASLTTVLESIVELIEQQAPDMLCAIHLLDAKRQALAFGASRRLPRAYMHALEGATIGPAEGSCGAAAATGQRVVVEDIAAHPNWTKYRPLALSHGLRACWSTPILAREGDVLGTCALYYREVRAPSAEDLILVDVAAHLAAIAVEHDRSQTSLRRAAERLALLHDLGDVMRELGSPEEVLPLALSMLGKQLGVARCAYGIVDDDGDRMLIPYDYADGAPSLAGVQYLSKFGPLLNERLRRSHEPFVVNDVAAELQAQDGRDGLLQMGFRAFVCCPLMRAGKLRALMAVIEEVPRTWRADEVELVNELVQRCWAYIERHNAETRLLANEALLKIATHAAKLGAWSVELPERRVTWSDEVCAIHGVPAGTSPTLEQLLLGYAPEYRAAIGDAMHGCITSGTAFDLEVQLQRADQSRSWVRAIGGAHRDAAGTITRVQGALQDLSDRRELEQQLLHSQKMEAVGKLAGGIAHDFNNLLTVILGYGSLLRERLAADAPMRSELDQIYIAGQRAKELTQQLLAFSRQQLLHPSVIDLNEVVGELDTLLRRLLSEDVTITLARARNLGQVLADRGQMHQVLMNLVVNARDAMPRGGSVVIETANALIDESDAASHGVAPGKYVRVSVTDTGTGMDAATRARVFEPFFTSKEHGKGTGLGLSTVWGIVTQSGGHVDVSSVPGAGTTFRVYLPRVDRRAEEVRASDAPISLRGVETILVVEDQEQVRVLLQTILERAGYQVLAAQNGGEALLICEQHKRAIDLLLTDVVMPRMSGRELAERLSTTRPTMRVLYVSGYAGGTLSPSGLVDDGAGDLAGAAGVAGVAGVAFVAKPPTPDTLLRKVREVLNAPR
jgi:two-component system, cell cycle sensor histidine kinase and response regulator CckA